MSRLYLLKHLLNGSRDQTSVFIVGRASNLSEGLSSSGLSIAHDGAFFYEQLNLPEYLSRTLSTIFLAHSSYTDSCEALHRTLSKLKPQFSY